MCVTFCISHSSTLPVGGLRDVPMGTSLFEKLVRKAEYCLADTDALLQNPLPYCVSVPVVTEPE